MASTVTSGAAVNTYVNTDTSGSFPGDAATGLRTRHIAKWVEALAPYETPLLSSIGTGSTVSHFKHEWGQSYQLPHSSTLAEALDDSETGIDVASGHGPRFQKYAVCLIKEDASGNAEEYVWCDADVSTDTLTVVRGQCGSSAVAHDSGTVIEFIGIAEPQLVDHPDGNFIYGDLAYNYPQRFATRLKFDEFAIHEPNLEFGSGDQLAIQIERKMKDLKILMEKAIVFGKRQAGTASVSAKRPSTMGGLRQFITTHTTDLDGAALSIYHVEEELNEIWNDNGENLPKVLIANMKTKRVLNRLFDGLRNNVSMSDSTVNTVWDTFKFESGTYRVGVSRRLDDGEIYGLDFSQMTIHPYKGQGWQTVELPVSGAYQIKAIRGAFTFELAAEASMFRLYGFDTTLANYPSIYS